MDRHALVLTFGLISSYLPKGPFNIGILDSCLQHPIIFVEPAVRFIGQVIEPTKGIWSSGMTSS
jgi:hypothetical protein